MILVLRQTSFKDEQNLVNVRPNTKTAFVLPQRRSLHNRGIAVFIGCCLRMRMQLLEAIKHSSFPVKTQHLMDRKSKCIICVKDSVVIEFFLIVYPKGCDHVEAKTHVNFVVRLLLLIKQLCLSVI